MASTTVAQSIDIAAPREEVWQVIEDVQIHTRLSPLWDVITIKLITPKPYALGSIIQLHKRRNGVDIEYRSEVVEYIAMQRIGYRLQNAQETCTSWKLQDCAVGTRLTYQDTFTPPANTEEREFADAVRLGASQWLKNIKLYCEWRGMRVLRLWRWLYHHLLMYVPYSHRQAFTMVLFLQFMMTLSFLSVAIFWAFALRQ